jgi:hypothetical protein
MNVHFETPHAGSSLSEIREAVERLWSRGCSFFSSRNRPHEAAMNGPEVAARAAGHWAQTVPLRAASPSRFERQIESGSR